MIFLKGYGIITLVIYDERKYKMIKHVVCFKFTEPTEASLKKAREILLSMDGKVPMVREIQVGEDILHSNRSYDLYLSVVVDDRKALDEIRQ